MNEKIKALATKAGINTETNPAATFPNEGLIVTEDYANLIIAECAALIDSWGDSGRYETFGQRLKAHFTTK